jgi:hypothetical protein
MAATACLGLGLLVVVTPGAPSASAVPGPTGGIDWRACTSARLAALDLE